MRQHPSGIPSLDDLLSGGLTLGDNVVWIADQRRATHAACRAFLAAAPTGAQVRYVSFSTSSAIDDLPPGIDRVDVRLPADPTDAADLEALLTDDARAEGSHLVIDGLDDVLARWGAPETVAFYRRICPRLFDLGAIAYWTGSREMLSAPVIEGITRIAQCVFELRGDRLRIAKAEGRPSRIQGTLVEIATDADGTLRIVREHAVGRLGEGLRRIRRERNLTQSQLAAVARVTPAAISQAETGRRGLSLDTLIPLCEALGITLDDLMTGPGTVEHHLVRHDRQVTGSDAAPGDVVALFDDPSAGLRSYLVNLDADETGSPMFSHKGLEVILVADGLVLIDLGEQTPVMRAGDALMVSRVPIRGWTNLRREPARLFWLVSG
ncbi:MAG: helix-turn-helix transcriptional regulator [Acidimicrobiia bacterium]|nr:helix-turn-helix transcriptional regulator [Acidimicrobiia bacterium]